MPSEDPEEFAGNLAERSVAAGDPTGWFEQLYAAAEAGQTEVPWDRRAPSPFLVRWAEQRGLTSGTPGKRAVIVGCGLGDDAQYIAGLGYQTVGFDISPTAIATARRRFPGSAVRYRTANLLDPPAEWHRAFDLVVESLTLQALPDPPRRDAIARVGDLVAPGGTLIVIARARDDGEVVAGPPWALTRSEIDAVGNAGLEPVRIEDMRDEALLGVAGGRPPGPALRGVAGGRPPGPALRGVAGGRPPGPALPWPRRWRAEFRRP